MLIYRSSSTRMHVHSTWQVCSKRQTTPKQASEILGSCMSRLQDNDQVSSAIKKAIIQVAGDRHMAAQETAYMVLNMPLTGCT